MFFDCPKWGIPIFNKLLNILCVFLNLKDILNMNKKIGGINNGSIKL